LIEIEIEIEESADFLGFLFWSYDSAMRLGIVLFNYRVFADENLEMASCFILV
jgi:hypothetical protein